MSDLATKFADLESQLATQHTTVGAKLDALLAALQASGTAECTNHYPTSTAFTLNGNYNGYSFTYPHSVQMRIDGGEYTNMPANTTYTFSVDTTSISFRDVSDYDEILVLCAPPQSAATLTSIAGILATISTTLTTIQLSNALYHTASLSVLNSIDVNIETMLQNNSSNAQLMIAALYATFCPCVTDAPLLPPALLVAPTDLVAEAKCRRIQYYLALFGSWLDKIANYGSAGAAVTGSAVGGLLGLAVAEAGLVGGEIGAVAGPPGVILGAVVGLIAGAVYTFGGAILSNIAISWHDAEFQDDLLLAMYFADSADSGNTAFHTTILASDIGTVASEVIYALFWSGWSNDIYSSTPVIDDSGFDGTICAPDPTIGCHEYTSIEFTGYYGGLATSFASLFDEAFETSGESIVNLPYARFDFYGWKFRLVAGGGSASLRYATSPGGARNPIHSLDATEYTITEHTAELIIIRSVGDGAFTVEICSPS